MRVVSQVPRLMGEKQIRENRLINAVTLARETGLSRPTIYKWIRNDLKRFDEESIVALCKYFNCDIADLIVLEKDE
jgi:putative transcriptional regulator